MSKEKINDSKDEKSTSEKAYTIMNEKNIKYTFAEFCKIFLHFDTQDKHKKQLKEAMLHDRDENNDTHEIEIIVDDSKAWSSDIMSTKFQKEILDQLDQEQFFHMKETDEYYKIWERHKRWWRRAIVKKAKEGVYYFLWVFTHDEYMTKRKNLKK